MLAGGEKEGEFAKLLTCIDKPILGQEALQRLMVVGVETKYEDVVHGDEEMGQITYVTSTVASV